MIKGIIESKTLHEICHLNTDVNWMVKSVTQNKNEIMININVNVKIQKNIAHAKKVPHTPKFLLII